MDARAVCLIRKVIGLLVVTTVVAGNTPVARAQVVPGTGEKLTEIGDDFEDPNWAYIPNLPKSSNNIDHQVRYPSGQVNNNRWFESLLRGQPDIVERVNTPAGGLLHSKGAMKLRSVQTPLWWEHPGIAFAERGRTRLPATVRAMGETDRIVAGLPPGNAHTCDEAGHRKILQEDRKNQAVGSGLARHVYPTQ